MHLPCGGIRAQDALAGAQPVPQQVGHAVDEQPEAEAYPHNEGEDCQHPLVQSDSEPQYGERRDDRQHHARRQAPVVGRLA
ncbi:hypothetical protein [Streptomyces olivochromogenes]|uniref:hypothetical protein n=1 Tax=Streptomyces olivochromogenes TaxID=1963 RepID=UPI00368E338B